MLKELWKSVTQPEICSDIFQTISLEIHEFPFGTADDICNGIAEKKYQISKTLSNKFLELIFKRTGDEMFEGTSEKKSKKLLETFPQEKLPNKFPKEYLKKM